MPTKQLASAPIVFLEAVAEKKHIIAIILQNENVTYDHGLLLEVILHLAIFPISASVKKT